VIISLMFAMLDRLTTSLQRYGRLSRMTLPSVRTLNISNQSLTTMAGSSARQILASRASGFQQNVGQRDLKPSQFHSLG
jgi:hypothetical protein